MKTILTAFFALAGIASADPCVLASIQTYEASSGCSIGPYTFSDFNYSTTGTITAPDQSNVFIDPRDADTTVRGSTIQTGFFVESPALWAIEAGNTGGITFSAHIVPDNPADSLLLLGWTAIEYPFSQIAGSSMTISGTIADQGGIIYSDSVSYNFTANGSGGEGGGSNIPIPASSQFLDATVGRSFTLGATGEDTFQGTWLGFQVDSDTTPLPSTTPEPASLSLGMVGLALVFLSKKLTPAGSGSVSN